MQKGDQDSKKSSSVHSKPKNSLAKFSKRVTKSAIMSLTVLAFTLSPNPSLLRGAPPKTIKIEQLSPDAIQDKTERIYSQLATKFQTAHKKMRESRLNSLNPHSEVHVEILPQSQFNLIEDEGRSVRMDDDMNIYINKDVLFDPNSFVASVCHVFAQSCFFESKTPLSLSFGNIAFMFMGHDAGYKIPKKYLGIMNSDLKLGLFFSALCGTKEFVDSYTSGVDYRLKKDFESKFGSGSYDMLCESDDSISDLLMMCVDNAEGKTLLLEANKIAHDMGLKKVPFEVDR